MGFYVVPQMHFVPPAIFGKGDISMMYETHPVNPRPYFFTAYYLIELAYHIEGLVYHAIQKPGNDFVEMFLHHLITVILIILSYMSSQYYIGILVLWVHDWADLFIGVIRTVMDCCGNIPTVTIYAFLMTSWIYSRCVLMPFVIMPSVFKNKNYVIVQDFTSMFLYSMLIILTILNYYWCFLLLKMGYRVATTGYSTDLQNQIGVTIEDKEIAEKQRDKIKEFKDKNE